MKLSRGSFCENDLVDDGQEPEVSDEILDLMYRKAECEGLAEQRLLDADCATLERAEKGTRDSLSAPAPLDPELTRLADFYLAERARVIAPPLPRLQHVALTAKLLPVPYATGDEVGH